MLSRFFYGISRLLVQSYARLLLTMDIHWQGIVPAGPVLFAANHPSTTDPILIQLISAASTVLVVYLSRH